MDCGGKRQRDAALEGGKAAAGMHTARPLIAAWRKNEAA
jgi:hypothetical protein